MAKYLVTGRGGSGKTTVQKALTERGFLAFDSDEVPGLVRSEDLETGRPIKIDWSDFVDFSKVGWNWQSEVLREFLAGHTNTFLCGSASNQLKFHNLFDKVFLLTVSPGVQNERLMNRRSKYGKNPAMRRWILGEQVRFAQQALALGAIAVDADVSPDQIVDEITSYLR